MLLGTVTDLVFATKAVIEALECSPEIHSKICHAKLTQF